MNRHTLALSVAALVMVAAAGASTAQGQTATADPLEARAKRILDRAPLIDGHNDLPWQIKTDFAGDLSKVDLRSDTSKLASPMHTDIPRLRQGGVGAQFWSVYVPADLAPLDAAKTVFEQIDLVRQMAARYPEAFTIVRTADELEAAHRRGRIGSIPGMEGGYAIADSLGLLREFRRAGVGYMTLAHSKTTSWADSATDAPKHGGLSPFGEDVVREMNRIGMLVDLSHVSPDAMRDAIGASGAPVIFSHSSARAVTDHPRNVPDDVLKLLPANGGVVMVTFVGSFVSDGARLWAAARTGERARLAALYPGEAAKVEAGMTDWERANPRVRATIKDVADHIDHVRAVAGIDHVGIGSDFDGVTDLPVGLEGVDDYPALFAELLRRGWSEADLKKLAGGNVLRAMRTAERVSMQTGR